VQEKQTWGQVALEFWRQTATDSAEDTTKKRKLHRTKAYERLCATTHMLLIATGVAWEFIVNPTETLLSPQEWPCATVRVDQGGDGWCALWLFISQDCDILLLFDWNPRTWKIPLRFFLFLVPQTKFALLSSPFWGVALSPVCLQVVQ
jgi:hypothetical protein